MGTWGEHEVIHNKERLSREGRFLVSSGAWPLAFETVDLPVFRRDTSGADLQTVHARIMRELDHDFGIASQYQIRSSHRRSWQYATHRLVANEVQEYLDTLMRRIRALEILHYMFAFRYSRHAPLLPGKGQSTKIVDLAYGLGTKLGDGPRYYDAEAGWTFVQRKGTQVHTNHLYIRA